MEKLILKFLWTLDGPQIAKTIVKTKQPSWETHTSLFQNLLQTSVVPSWRQFYKWTNRLEIPEINAYIYDELIFDKGAKVFQWGKNSLFKNWWREMVE